MSPRPAPLVFAAQIFFQPRSCQGRTSFPVSALPWVEVGLGLGFWNLLPLKCIYPVSCSWGLELCCPPQDSGFLSCPPK